MGDEITVTLQFPWLLGELRGNYVTNVVVSKFEGLILPIIKPVITHGPVPVPSTSRSHILSPYHPSYCSPTSSFQMVVLQEAA